MSNPFCRPNYNQDDYQCVCKPGYSGVFCETGRFLSLSFDFLLVAVYSWPYSTDINSFQMCVCIYIYIYIYIYLKANNRGEMLSTLI